MSNRVNRGAGISGGGSEIFQVTAFAPPPVVVLAAWIDDQMFQPPRPRYRRAAGAAGKSEFSVPPNWHNFGWEIQAPI
jgi:hypothetical protein